MSRPQKIHKPIKGDFNSILGAVAMGSGMGRRTAVRLARSKPQQEKVVRPPETKPSTNP